VVVVRAPQRAQRVRGVPGVGLRTPDGREWLRWGAGHRWDPETITAPVGPGWVVARCDHPGGGLALPEDDGAREMGACWSICKDCSDNGLATFTVKPCDSRRSGYRNPYGVREPHNKAWDPTAWSVWDNGQRLPQSFRSREDAMDAATFLFGAYLAEQTISYFAKLIGFDYLSCFCPLDSSCHVDAIIAEGKRRGVWI
jgi:hypothetical protein